MGPMIAVCRRWVIGRRGPDDAGGVRPRAADNEDSRSSYVIRFGQPFFGNPIFGLMNRLVAMLRALRFGFIVSKPFALKIGRSLLITPWIRRKLKFPSVQPGPF